jgi:DNA repair protein SbcD/Mre11
VTAPGGPRVVGAGGGARAGGAGGAGAVRLVHMSDWHLGSTVRGETRAPDHDEVIAEIVSIAAEHQPDLIVHTGDLFDGTRPGHDDLLRGLRAVRRLAEIAPIVILAGNHDASSCFDLLAEAVGAPAPEGGWDPHGLCREPIRFIPKPCTPERGAVATYATAAGITLRMACLPFVHANRVITGYEAFEDINATYADKVGKITRALAESAFEGFDPATMVAVWASHLHVDGAQLSSERAIHVAESYATDASQFDAGYSYLAFGHIHRPQELPGGRGRYAGSPLEIDFGEEAERKSVVLVTASPGTRARIDVRELSGGRRLRRVRGSVADLGARAEELTHAIAVVTVDEADEDVDSLSRVVRDALPETTVVQVIDGRRPAEQSLDEMVDEGGREETVAAAYRRWLTEGGDPGIVGSDLRRAVELFDELLGNVAAGEEPDPLEAVTLERAGGGG